MHQYPGPVISCEGNVIAMSEVDTDISWMNRAIELAQRAAAMGEVPVGAVITRGDQLLGEGFNQPIAATDPTGHAEINALRDAARRAGNYRLPGVTLYVTIEPCTMCLGAMIHARVERLVFGAREPRAGAVVSQLKLSELDHYNHRLSWTEGVQAHLCSELLTGFFRERRKK
jgi:tRNA(adenine34) deaminase